MTPGRWHGARTSILHERLCEILIFFLTVSVFLFSANLKKSKFAKYFCAQNFICNNISSEIITSKWWYFDGSVGG